MNKKLKYILIILISLVFLPVNGQTDDEQPAPPTLLLATINQDNGFTELLWTANTEPDLAGYALYNFRNGEGYIIDSLFNPSATSYSFLNLYSNERSECYVIAAFDNARNISRLSNELCTIHARSYPDPCNNLIKISWSEYPSFPFEVSRYEIMESENGGPFFLAGQAESEGSVFNLDNVTEGSRYDFIIKAVLENGQSSSSNLTSAVASLTTPPQWINADYATITDDGEIDLSFHIDPSSDIDTFALERRTGFSGLFQQIHQFTGGDIESLIYTDKPASPDDIYFYRLSAVICKQGTATSNTASNIRLTLTNTGNEIILKWNRYRQWRGSVSSYAILADKGNGFESEAVAGPADTIFSVSIPDIMYELEKEEICFRIRADETDNPFGIEGEAFSGIACTTIEEVVTVPNIFTPDGDGINDFFRPVITFTPSEYRLIIADRRRNTLFETRDYTESWDGTAGGAPAPRGVVMWHLRMTTPSGRIIDRTGTLTIVRR
ncbi:MAG: gliding motility-associated C-terminal domain-containing protein [Bacteroidales bacterium]|jgi:gliding motility-associated-like protein|nr:gliding motility-associated C-terminal domain-containing protein [Bacteroidales bacterium]